MKKLVFFFVIFLLTAGAFAQSNQKTIKMVTYFPVPYIIYKHLDVYGRCDVGILDTCNMSVGKDVVVAPFNVVTGRDSRLNTGKILVQRGNLQLDSATGGVLATSYIRIRPKETIRPGW